MARLKRPTARLATLLARVVRLPALVAISIALGAVSCGGGVEDLPGAKGDLLAGRSPSSSSGAQHTGRMTDGFVANDGGFWRSDVTAFMPAGASVLWDLGEPKAITCAYLQGDNNDTYEVQGSEDGTTFTSLWTAGPVPRSGMQPRTDQHLGGRARYVRLTAHGGDGFYSISELALFSACGAEWPPRFVPKEGTSDEDNVNFKLMIFGIVSGVFLLINRKGARDWVRLGIVVPLGLGLSTFLDLRAMWPFEEPVQTVVRAVVAGIATILVFREYVWPRLYPVSVKASMAGLALLAVVAGASYYHFGWPQFRDESKGRQTLVHPWDMRVYFPVAKYFRELRFDGLYLASVAAHLDNHPGMAPESVANAHMRDLTNNEMRTAGQVMDQIQGVRKRFSPERWESFKKDMKYFEDVMGPGAYLGSMQDHGGNATPVWILGAYLLWHNAPANELTLTLTGLIDPMLWILLFVVMARTFGVRVMLICLVVWGTTDFSRFGTNLMGSTLRADWMVALGLGACALRKRRWALGGGLMAYGGLIRAFPAFASMFLALPPLWWVIDRWRATRKLPALGEFTEANRPALRALGGVVLTVGVLVGVSSALFGFADSWKTWGQKITMHAEQPNSNHVGIRNVVSYSPSLEGHKVADDRRIEPWSTWQDLQRETFARRKPLFYLAVLLYLGLAVVACRRLRLEQAAMLGLMMIPVFFYPANYYCHHVFLLPLLAVGAGPKKLWSEAEGRTWFGLVSAIFLAMGFFQYFTLDAWAGESDRTATAESVIMLIAYLLVLVPLGRAAWAGRPPLDETPLGDGTEPPPRWTGPLGALWRSWQGDSDDGDADDEDEDDGDGGDEAARASEPGVSTV